MTAVALRAFLPGPCAVRPALRDAPPLAPLGAGDPSLPAAFARLQPGLRALFGTARDVVVDGLPGSALLEAAIRSGVRKRVLVVSGGHFGGRLARAATSCGREVVELNVAAGRPLDAALARRFLDGPPVDAVLVSHAESGTGLLAPVAELCAVWRERHDCLVLLDAVATFGGAPLAVDAWGVDFAYGTSHLALGLPPGLSFAVLGPRFLERALHLADRGWALDLLRHQEAARRGRTLHTPPAPLLGMLDAQLAAIAAAGGAEARWARHAALAARVAEWVAARPPLALVAPEGHRAPTLSVVRLPEGRRAMEVVAAMTARGFAVAAAFGDLADRALAIGHMGDLTLPELDAMLAALDEVLAPR